MGKSKPVPIRFSLDELETIEKFMKKYDMKSMNDLARLGVAFLIAFLSGFEKLLASGHVEQIEAWQKSTRNELSKNKKSYKKFSEAFRIIEETIVPKIEEDLAEGAKIVKPFAKKRKSGRPKKLRKKRGRPKNLGYLRH